MKYESLFRWHIQDYCILNLSHSFTLITPHVRTIKVIFDFMIACLFIFVDYMTFVLANKTYGDETPSSILGVLKSVLCCCFVLLCKIK